jgi:hypothetical protein
VSPCKPVAALDQEGWRHVGKGIIPELSLPPTTLERLAVHRLLGLSWEDIGDVPLY